MAKHGNPNVTDFQKRKVHSKTAGAPESSIPLPFNGGPFPFPSLSVDSSVTAMIPSFKAHPSNRCGPKNAHDKDGVVWGRATWLIILSPLKEQFLFGSSDKMCGFFF
ncbi:hypothetical protein QJS04_geneDACA017597 [Acorus gramineus]|uniref:Uncharacterized protein n=1 Tax=Acorus gramineus TaxID=55184 RepID=A0AAV9AYJ3_ACOGR|nr:hypothetical protein QJS04_geneDACA017597 [Acorus gramineus]